MSFKVQGVWISPWKYLICPSELLAPTKQWLYKCYKVHDDHIELDMEQAENVKNAERQKKSFLKE